MDGYPFVIDKRVRYSETDSAGILNNISVFKYFEIGRIECWRTAGIRVPEINSNGTGFVMVRQECDYRRPVYPDEMLEVGVRLGGIGNTSFTTEYQVCRKATGEVVANGKTVHVVMDVKDRTLLPVPRDIREKMEKIGEQ